MGKWEKIEYVDKQRLGRVSVTIQSSGRISFSAGFRELYLKNSNYMELFYDPDQKLIAMRPSKEKKNGAFPIQSVKWGGKLIPAKFFLSQYNLIPPSAKKYDAKWDRDEALIIVDLKNAIPKESEIIGEDEENEDQVPF